MDSEQAIKHCPNCDRSLLDEWEECPDCGWTDPDPEIELRVGENYISVSDGPTRCVAIAFLVGQLDITPGEVAGVRRDLGMDAPDNKSTDTEDETDE